MDLVVSGADATHHPQRRDNVYSFWNPWGIFCETHGFPRRIYITLSLLKSGTAVVDGIILLHLPYEYIFGEQRRQTPQHPTTALLSASKVSC